MLMTIVFLLLLLLLGGFIILRIKRQDRQATPRRYQRQPRVSHKEEILATFNNDTDDTNDALGLNEILETPREKKQQPARRFSEYLVLHVMAPQECAYNGYELLQSLLANGLRYGDMDIFHRHETKTGRGQVLFSLASVNKPGTFELPKMGSFSCPGLTLFMPLKHSPDPMIAFDTMLETAKQLAEDLGGEVWDESRYVLNMDKIAQMRAQIHQFEKNQCTPDFFAELQSD